MTQMLIKSPIAALLESWATPAYCFYTIADNWPVSGFAVAQFELQYLDGAYYYGTLPGYAWLVYPPFYGDFVSYGQIVFKADIISTTGVADNNYINGNATRFGQWWDYNTYWRIEVDDSRKNGLAVSALINISIAEGDGAGNPIPGTIVTKPVTFYAYRGYQETILRDEFTDTNRALNAHIANLYRNPYTTSGYYPWDDLYQLESNYDAGQFRISSNNVYATEGTTAFPGAISVLDTLITDFSFGVGVDYGFGGEGGFGILGRVQDSENFWLLQADGILTANPVLSLIKMLAGTPTTVATYTMTGYGPLAWSQFKAMRLEFVGDNITGAYDIDEGDPGIAIEPIQVTYTDSAFNTETRCGLYSDGTNAGTSGCHFRRCTVLPAVMGFDAIVWSASPFTATCSNPQTTSNNQSAYCFLYFYPGSNGLTVEPYDSSCFYNVPPGDTGEAFAHVIDWRCVTLSFPSPFIVKYENVSGDTGRLSWKYTGPNPGVWIDLYNATIDLDADANYPGEYLTAVVDITVALDDGTGNPLAGTEHTKRVTMNADNTA